MTKVVKVIKQATGEELSKPPRGRSHRNSGGRSAKGGMHLAGIEKRTNAAIALSLRVQAAIKELPGVKAGQISRSTFVEELLREYFGFEMEFGSDYLDAQREEWLKKRSD